MARAEFQRARSPEHKAQRAEEILIAATRVLDRHGIDGVTLAGIAAEAGVVKSNLYRYFESREEILIRILTVEADALIAEVSAAVARLDRPDDLRAMADIFAASCTRRPRFCLLLSRMGPILERNVSVETIGQIKCGMVGPMQAMAAALLDAAPSLGTGGASFAVKALTHVVAGLWPMAHPAPPVAQALAIPGLAMFREDFETALARTGHALLEGIRVQQACR